VASTAIPMAITFDESRNRRRRSEVLDEHRNKKNKIRLLSAINGNETAKSSPNLHSAGSISTYDLMNKLDEIEAQINKRKLKI
jgi:hypothetical protein